MSIHTKSSTNSPSQTGRQLTVTVNGHIKHAFETIDRARAYVARVESGKELPVMLESIVLKSGSQRRLAAMTKAMKLTGKPSNSLVSIMITD